MSRLLVLTGVASLAVLVVIAITGGFVFHVGPLRVSAHSLGTPLALALLAWAIAFARGRVPASTAAAELLPLLERHAGAVALVAAVAAAGVGVAYGTYAAAGADASGYVSEAALLASGRLVRDEPLARTVKWPEGTWTVSPLGYRPGREIGELVPTYPPGLAVTMVVATLIGGEWAVYLVVPLLGALAVWCTYLLGARLHSNLAGLIGAVLLATSPIFLFQVVQPMSDVAVAAWWALAFTLSVSPARGGVSVSPARGGVSVSPARGGVSVSPANGGVAPSPTRGRAALSSMRGGMPLSPAGGAAGPSPVRGAAALPRDVDEVAHPSPSGRVALSSSTDDAALAPATDVIGAFACGATAGLAILTRPNLLPLALPLALVLAGTRTSLGRRAARSSRLRRLGWFAVGLLPAACALLFLNWRLYGSSLASGYGTVGELFDAANVVPNARAYASKLLSGEPAAIALAAASLIVLAARPRRAALVNIRPVVVVAALTGGMVAACYLPYGVFTEWFYLRFLLPAFPMAAVCVGALTATAFLRIPQWFPQWLRGTALVLTLTTVAAWNVTVAAQEQAFNLARYEARYRVAGRYLASALPDNAVVLTVQHSGSVAHYTGLPIVRWDFLGDDLDAALAAMRELGRRPVLLIEEWEASQLRERFPRSPAAQLDWPPLAEFGTNVRVRFYDLADRGTISATRFDRLR